jgi:hypothetical protein
MYDHLYRSVFSEMIALQRVHRVMLSYASLSLCGSRVGSIPCQHAHGGLATELSRRGEVHNESSHKRIGLLVLAHMFSRYISFSLLVTALVIAEAGHQITSDPSQLRHTISVI